MKYIFLMIASFLLSGRTVIAQTKNLTDTSYKEWTHVSSGIISNDGKYASYVISNHRGLPDKRVIISTDRKWKKEFTANGMFSFSDDSRYAFYQRNDTLIQQLLGSEVIFSMPGCVNYNLLQSGKKQWLIYQHDVTIKQTIIKDLGNDQSVAYGNIEEVFPDAINSSVVLRSVEGGNHVLKWLDLNTGKVKVIYSGANPENLIFDATGTQMAFKTTEVGTNNLWHYRTDQAKCKSVLKDKESGLLNNHVIATNATWAFTADGKSLYFTQDTVPDLNKPSNSDVLISSYKDAFPVRVYDNIKDGLRRGRNLSLLNLKTLKVRQLLNGLEKPESNPSGTGDLFVFSIPLKSDPTRRLEPEIRKSYYAYTASNGAIYTLQENADFTFVYSISPSGKYVAFKSNVDSAIKVLDITSKAIKSLNNTDKFGTFSQSKDTDRGQIKFIGWIGFNENLLVQDQFDIWRINMDGKSAPKNLTKALGDNHQVIYFPVTEYAQRYIGSNEDLYLIGHNVNTKKISLNRLSLQQSKFEKLIELKAKFSDIYSATSSTIFSKARDAQSYLYLSGNVSKTPNYYFTKDFKSPVLLSEQFPERNFNWIESELLTYQDKFGQQYQALLYKPSNFDTLGKYPVIFMYYRSMSHNLFEYIKPAPVGADINIPLIVSAGYLVVCPDLVYSQGKSAAESCLLGLNSAVDYLQHKSYVDTGHLGVVGHSFGGFETNYIITHSNRFAAAISGASIANLIQYAYESHKESGGTNEGYTKAGFGFKKSMESDVSPFLRESSVLLAKNIVTPLLLAHNENDSTVDVSHSAQLFYQLRALRKPVWWLNYPEEPHMVLKLENQLDYQFRVKGFLDHFLMGKPLPVWMDSPNHF